MTRISESWNSLLNHLLKMYFQEDEYLSRVIRDIIANIFVQYFTRPSEDDINIIYLLYSSTSNSINKKNKKYIKNLLINLKNDLNNNIINYSTCKPITDMKNREDGNCEWPCDIMNVDDLNGDLSYIILRKDIKKFIEKILGNHCECYRYFNNRIIINIPEDKLDDAKNIVKLYEKNNKCPRKAYKFSELIEWDTKIEIHT